MNSSSTVQARSTEAAPRPLSHQASERQEHGRHRALDVARPAAIEAAALDRGNERGNGHAPDRHRVLMDVKEDAAASARVVIPGQQIVAIGGDGLTLERERPARGATLRGRLSAATRGTRGRRGRGPSG